MQRFCNDAERFFFKAAAGRRNVMSQATRCSTPSAKLNKDREALCTWTACLCRGGGLGRPFRGHHCRPDASPDVAKVRCLKQGGMAGLGKSNGYTQRRPTGGNGAGLANAMQGRKADVGPALSFVRERSSMRRFADANEAPQGCRGVSSA